MKVFTIQLSVSELRNNMQGLEMCLQKCKKNLAEINPNDQSSEGLKEYFLKKITELKTQLEELNLLIK